MNLEGKKKLLMQKYNEGGPVHAMSFVKENKANLSPQEYQYAMGLIGQENNKYKKMSDIPPGTNPKEAARLKGIVDYNTKLQRNVKMYNIGGMADDDDVWGPDPMIQMAQTPQLQQMQRTAPQVQTGGDPYQGLKQEGLAQGVNLMFGDEMDPKRMALAGLTGFMGFNKGGQAEEPPIQDPNTGETLWPWEDGYWELRQQTIQGGIGSVPGDTYIQRTMPIRGTASRAWNMMTGVGNYNTGGSVDHLNPVDKRGMSAGQWVGKRCKYLNDGGMAQQDAEMQAYNEMQGLTGPGTTGAGAMMPPQAPMPEQYTPQNDFGYIPSGGGPSYKEQMEKDKMDVARAQAMDKEERDNKAFSAAERRKEETHRLQMQQKKEAHAESMKQKRAGPLSQGG